MNVPLVLLATRRELPEGDDWLAPSERATAGGLHVPKRRGDYLLGRLAAKRALVLLEASGSALPGRGEVDASFRLGPDRLRRFEVRPAAGGAPTAWCDGVPLAVTLSISHSGGWAAACIQRGAGPLGCDLERIETRSAAFLEDYFTPGERGFVARGPEIERGLRATLLWSGKEAVMKALGEGLRLPAATVEIEPFLGTLSPADWRRFSVLAPVVGLGGWWRPVGEMVLTVAGGFEEPVLVGPAAEPVLLSEGVAVGGEP